MKESTTTKDVTSGALAPLLTVSKFTIEKIRQYLDDLTHHIEGFEEMFEVSLQQQEPDLDDRRSELKKKNSSRGGHSYWAKMTFKERSEEMKRRRNVARGIEPSIAAKALEQKPLSMVGIKRGTDEFRARDAINKRILYAKKKAGETRTTLLDGLGRIAKRQSEGGKKAWLNKSPKQQKAWKKKINLAKAKAAAERARVNGAA